MRGRADAIQIFEAALAAVEPYRAVRRVLDREGNALSLRQDDHEIRFDLDKIDHLHVVGCGKAGAPMARAVEDLVGDRISSGLVVVKHGHDLPGEVPPARISLAQAAHPEPDVAGLRHAQEVVGVLQGASERDLVLALVSGGGSALWPLPVPTVSLSDKVELTRQLLASGADIHEINAVRKHVSRIKGGWAAKAAYPAQVLVLLISDVIGDRVDSIASGPFAPDTTSFGEALEILEHRGLGTGIPVSIQYHLWDGLAGKVAETPAADDPAFARVRHCICASNSDALEAARIQAEAMGYRVAISERPISGDVRAAAEAFCDRLRALSEQSTGQPVCLLGGGETTVRLGGSDGMGGRNQQFALASAFEIQGREGLTVLSCGTDGTDGPTDAAGAVVDGSTVDRCRSLGQNPRAALEGFDAYPLFEHSGDLVRTGPTLSNVMDLIVGIAS
jgi:glycerate 2-kinase